MTELPPHVYRGRRAGRRNNTSALLGTPAGGTPPGGTSPGGNQPWLNLNGSGVLGAIAEEASSRELHEIDKWRQSMVPSAQTLDAIRQLQAILPPADWEGKNEESKDEQRKRLKTHALHELIQTEKDYVSDLRIIVDVFLVPMTQLLAPQETAAVFSNIKIILSINEQLLKDMQAIKVKGGTEGNQVGKIFNMTADYLKVYTQYCANQEKCVRVMAQLEKNKELSKFLDEAHHNKKCRNLMLSAFLIKPIQRICKYPLLLRELVRHTSEEEADYKELSSALEKLSSIVSHVNDQKRKVECLQEILAIQVTISGKSDDFLFKRGRIFISESTFDIFDEKKGKKNTRHFFLFSDVLLYVRFKKLTTSRKKYAYDGTIALRNASIKPIKNNALVLVNAFKVWTRKKTIIVCCDNLANRDLWVEAIQSRIKFEADRAKERKAKIAEQTEAELAAKTPEQIKREEKESFDKYAAKIRKKEQEAEEKLEEERKRRAEREKANKEKKDKVKGAFAGVFKRRKTHLKKPRFDSTRDANSDDDKEVDESKDSGSDQKKIRRSYSAKDVGKHAIQKKKVISQSGVLDIKPSKTTFSASNEKPPEKKNVALDMAGWENILNEKGGGEKASLSASVGSDHSSDSPSGDSTESESPISKKDKRKSGSRLKIKHMIIKKKDPKSKGTRPRASSKGSRPRSGSTGPKSPKKITADLPIDRGQTHDDLADHIRKARALDEQKKKKKKRKEKPEALKPSPLSKLQSPPTAETNEKAKVSEEATESEAATENVTEPSTETATAGNGKQDGKEQSEKAPPIVAPLPVRGAVVSGLRGNNHGKPAIQSPSPDSDPKTESELPESKSPSPASLSNPQNSRGRGNPRGSSRGGNHRSPGRNAGGKPAILSPSPRAHAEPSSDSNAGEIVSPKTQSVQSSRGRGSLRGRGGNHRGQGDTKPTTHSLSPQKSESDLHPKSTESNAAPELKTANSLPNFQTSRGRGNPRGGLRGSNHRGRGTGKTITKSPSPSTADHPAKPKQVIEFPKKPSGVNLRGNERGRRSRGTGRGRSPRGGPRGNNRGVRRGGVGRQQRGGSPMSRGKIADRIAQIQHQPKSDPAKDNSPVKTQSHPPPLPRDRFPESNLPEIQNEKEITAAVATAKDAPRETSKIDTQVEVDRKRKEEEETKAAEERKRKEAADAAAKAEQERIEEEKKAADAAEAKAESERAAKAEQERKDQAERKRKEADIKAAADAAAAKAKEEQEAAAKAEAEKKRKEAEMKAAADAKAKEKQEAAAAAAKAEQERKAAQEAREKAAKAEQERKRIEKEAAKAEAEKKRKEAEVAKAEQERNAAQEAREKAAKAEQERKAARVPKISVSERAAQVAATTPPSTTPTSARSQLKQRAVTEAQPPPPLARDNPIIGTCTAAYAIQGKLPSDLTFPAGATIQLIKCHGNWWTGRYQDHTGQFPKNYVTAVTMFDQAPPPLSRDRTLNPTRGGRSPNPARGGRSPNPARGSGDGRGRSPARGRGGRGRSPARGRGDGRGRSPARGRDGRGRGRSPARRSPRRGGRGRNPSPGRGLLRGRGRGERGRGGSPQRRESLAPRIRQMQNPVLEKRGSAPLHRNVGKLNVQQLQLQHKLFQPPAQAGAGASMPPIPVRDDDISPQATDTSEAYSAPPVPERDDGL